MESLFNKFLTMFNLKDLSSLDDAILVLIGKIISAILILIFEQQIVPKPNEHPN